MKKRSKKETRYLTVLTVYATGAEELIYLMRYERCVPLTEAEAHKIVALVNQDKTAHEPTLAEHVIRLLRLAVADSPAAADMWRSFGCRVLDERSPEDVQLTDAEILHLAEVSK